MAGPELAVDGAFGPKTDAGSEPSRPRSRSPRPASPTRPPGPSSRRRVPPPRATSSRLPEEVEGVEGVAYRRVRRKPRRPRWPFPWASTSGRSTRTATAGSASGWPTSRRSGAPLGRSTKSHPEKKSMDLRLRGRRALARRRRRVQARPTAAQEARALSRSDSGLRTSSSPVASMAPHQFGHLIRLADENNRTRSTIWSTGEEPAVGDPTGASPDATKLAADIKAKPPLDGQDRRPPAATERSRLGARTWPPSSTPKLGTKARAASPAWSPRTTPRSTAVALPPTTSRRPSATRVSPGSRPNLSACVTPFLYSKRSPTGTMETTPAKGGGGKVPRPRTSTRSNPGTSSRSSTCSPRNGLQLEGRQAQPDADDPRLQQHLLRPVFRVEIDDESTALGWQTAGHRVGRFCRGPVGKERKVLAGALRIARGADPAPTAGAARAAGVLVVANESPRTICRP